MKLITLFICCAFTFPLFADSDYSVTAEKIREAMNNPIRGEVDTHRDRNRKPVETLEFFGLRDDMKVLELLPGGGWYTKILAGVLGEQGQLFVSIGTSGVEKNLLGKPGFEKVKVLPFPRDNFLPAVPGSRRSGIKSFSFPSDDFDMVLTFRNMHNFNKDGRLNMTRATFSALKSGGLFGVIDHTRRHMQKNDPENGRRMDPVLVIQEIESAGFDFVSYSPLHYRADDELRYEVGRKTVTGNTDRFTLLFRKP